MQAAEADGLLHRPTQVTAEAGFDIASAKVATLGHEVVDAFYLRSAATGGKVDPARFAELRHRLMLAAGGDA